jgi:predicted DNA-binding protein
MTQKVTFDRSVKANFEDETYEKIERIAREKGTSKSATVREIVREKLMA